MLQPRFAALAVVAALVIAACGGGDSTEGDQEASGPSAALTASDPAERLAEHRAQADTLIGEGEAAFERRLAALEGTPVVVNQWASWCPSCRFELPFFESMSAEFADRVAFLGLDSQDDRASARAFLAEHPSGYPSVFDPDAEVARSVGAGQSWPTTVFYDAEGEQVHIRPGAYATAELLEADIRRFALGEGQ